MTAWLIAELYNVHGAADHQVSAREVLYGPDRLSAEAFLEVAANRIGATGEWQN